MHSDHVLTALYKVYESHIAERQIRLLLYVTYYLT